MTRHSRTYSIGHRVDGTGRGFAEGSESGVALLLVIWMSALFGLVVTGFAFSSRVETDAARNFQDQVRAKFLAEAGISQAIAELADTRPGARSSAGPFRPFRIGPKRLGVGTYDAMVTNEDGKISLNHASETVLKRLLEHSGVQDALLRESIAASILDWRDPDDVEHNGGAETGFYKNRSLSYAAKNGPFQRVEELLAVRGMTREILYGTIVDRARRDALRNAVPDSREFAAGEHLGIFPYLTTRSSGRIDYATADMEVLYASELSPQRLQELLQTREQEREQTGIGQGVRHTSGPAVGAGSSPRIYRIESIGRIDGSPLVVQIQATVAREGTMRVPRYRVLAWQERGD